MDHTLVINFDEKFHQRRVNIECLQKNPERSNEIATEYNGYQSVREKLHFLPVMSILNYWQYIFSLLFFWFIFSPFVLVFYVKIICNVIRLKFIFKKLLAFVSNICNSVIDDRQGQWEPIGNPRYIDWSCMIIVRTRDIRDFHKGFSLN